MNMILSFMDKIYSDSSTLSIIYIVGAILLFVFILLLIFSLRKPNNLGEKIIEEPNMDEDTKKEESVTVDTNIVSEEDVVLQEEKEETKVTLSNILDKSEERIEEKDFKENIEIKEEEIELPNLSAEIPDVDEFVDNVVKKTYEKNEQFSSVYVSDNTSTIKLDKVLDNLIVDESIKEDIVPVEEKEIISDKNENCEEVRVEVKEPEKIDKLDSLKKALNENKKNVNLKQDDLKSKLENLKNNNSKKSVLKEEDLLNKLKNLKKD